MKTFSNLKFEQHPLSKNIPKDIINETYLFKSAGNLKQAIITFDNGVKLSVVFGDIFYSDGKTTYEACVLENPIDDEYVMEPRGYLTKDQVTEFMKELQSLGE